MQTLLLCPAVSPPTLPKVVSLQREPDELRTPGTVTCSPQDLIGNMRSHFSDIFIPQGSIQNNGECLGRSLWYGESGEAL